MSKIIIKILQPGVAALLETDECDVAGGKSLQSGGWKGGRAEEEALEDKRRRMDTAAVPLLLGDTPPQSPQAAAVSPQEAPRANAPNRNRAGWGRLTPLRAQPWAQDT